MSQGVQQPIGRHLFRYHGFEWPITVSAARACQQARAASARLLEGASLMASLSCRAETTDQHCASEIQEARQAL